MAYRTDLRLGGVVYLHVLIFYLYCNSGASRVNTIVSEKYMEAVKPLQGVHCCSEVLKMFLFLTILFKENAEFSVNLKKCLRDNICLFLNLYVTKWSEIQL